MASDKVKHVLSSEGMRDAENELAFLFRKMCNELDMLPRTWESRLQRYLDKALPSTPANPKERAYARGNINNQFLAKTMTWRTFMEALKFIGPRGAELIMRLDWGHGNYSEHRISLRGRMEDTPLLEALMLEDEIPSTVLRKREEMTQAPPINRQTEVGPSGNDPDYIPDL